MLLTVATRNIRLAGWRGYTTTALDTPPLWKRSPSRPQSQDGRATGTDGVANTAKTVRVFMTATLCVTQVHTPHSVSAYQYRMGRTNWHTFRLQGHETCGDGARTGGERAGCGGGVSGGGLSRRRKTLVYPRSIDLVFFSFFLGSDPFLKTAVFARGGVKFAFSGKEGNCFTLGRYKREFGAFLRASLFPVAFLGGI
jgi:hypothetical protein